MNEARCASPEIYNQEIFNRMRLPLNDNYIAVSYAVRDLLKEGWILSGFTKAQDTGVMPKECLYVELYREWKC